MQPYNPQHLSLPAFNSVWGCTQGIYLGLKLYYAKCYKQADPGPKTSECVAGGAVLLHCTGEQRLRGLDLGKTKAELEVVLCPA